MKSGVVQTQALYEQTPTGTPNIAADVSYVGSGFARRWHERGQGLVEYALIIVLIALVVALALSMIAPTLNSIFRSIPPAL